MSLITMFLMTMAKAQELSVVDSPVDNKYIFVVINDCYAPVPKSKRNDYCYILKKVNSYCGMDLDIQECRHGK